MTLTDMHVWFRQYAQQMGMQNVRALLPEQIDLLINTSITDTVNQIIRENVGITNDRVITDNSKIGQINALRTLYHVVEIDLCPTNGTPPFTAINKDKRVFTFDKVNKKTGKLSTNFVRSHTESADEYHDSVPEYLYLVDFAINYKKTTTGFDGIPDISTRYNYTNPPAFAEDTFETNYFPVRIIDDAYLADTLNDFVLKNRLRSPIIVTYNNGTFDLYIEEFVKKTISNVDVYTLRHDLVPFKLRMSYIAAPAKVEYKSDVSDDANTNCDLPDYMHIDILKHAVDLYKLSISGGLNAAQQQGQAQQQEDVRNNYRNEGFQQ